MSDNQNYPPLSYSLIRISGPDRTVFLQGLITNDIELLNHQPMLYACLLSPQGKFLFDFMVVSQDQSYLIMTDLQRADELLKKLSQYKLRAKVEMTQDNHFFSGRSEKQIDPFISTPDPRHPDLGFINISQKAYTTDDTYFERWDKTRIRLGIADGVRDAEIGLSTLEELNITKYHGVSFTKGCYVGQELTARLHHRGLSKKHLQPVELADNAPDNQPDIIDQNSIVVGQMRSVNGAIGLALLKDESLSSKLTCNGKPLKVLI